MTNLDEELIAWLDFEEDIECQPANNMPCSNKADWLAITLCEKDIPLCDTHYCSIDRTPGRELICSFCDTEWTIGVNDHVRHEKL